MAPGPGEGPDAFGDCSLVTRVPAELGYMRLAATRSGPQACGSPRCAATIVLPPEARSGRAEPTRRGTPGPGRRRDPNRPLLLLGTTTRRFLRMTSLPGTAPESLTRTSPSSSA